MDASAAGPVGVDYRGVLEVINGLESSNLEERKLVCLAAVHWEGRINSDFKGAVDGFAYNLLRKFVFEAREGRAHDFYGCNSRRAIEAAYPGSRKAKKDYKKKRDVNALCLDLFVRYLQKYRRAEVPAELHGLRCVQAYMNVYVEGQAKPITQWTVVRLETVLGLAKKEMQGQILRIEQDRAFQAARAVKAMQKLQRMQKFEELRETVFAGYQEVLDYVAEFLDEEFDGFCESLKKVFEEEKEKLTISMVPPNFSRENFLRGSTCQSLLLRISELLCPHVESSGLGSRDFIIMCFHGYSVRVCASNKIFWRAYRNINDLVILQVLHHSHSCNIMSEDQTKLLDREIGQGNSVRKLIDFILEYIPSEIKITGGLYQRATLISQFVEREYSLQQKYDALDLIKKLMHGEEKKSYATCSLLSSLEVFLEPQSESKFDIECIGAGGGGGGGTK